MAGSEVDSVRRLRRELANCCGWPAPIATPSSRPLSMRGREGKSMQEEIHLVREHLFESEHLCERLSSQVSDRRISADLAPLVDALRQSVLCAMRVAHALELAAKLVETQQGS
jgi:hypothetical protein